MSRVLTADLTTISVQSHSMSRITPWMVRSLVAMLFALGYAKMVKGEDPVVELVDISSVRTLSSEAAESIRKGELLIGAEKLEEAIHLYQGDVLRDHRASFVIKDENLEWGEQQLHRVLRDRPALKKFVVKDSPLWDWLCQAFGGALASSEVEWDPVPPTGRLAAHRMPQRSSRGKIRVAQHYPEGTEKEGMPVEAEEILSALCYEMHNMAHEELHRILFTLAWKGSISKEVYVREAFVAEFHAIQDTRAFYAKNILPWFHDRGYASNPKYWWVEGWWYTDEQVRYVATSDKDRYPWVPFAKMYDDLRESAVKERARHSEKGK